MHSEGAGLLREAATSPMAGTLSPNTGGVSVELDALPVNVLRTRIVAEVEKRMDSDPLAEVRQLTALVVGCYALWLDTQENSQ